MAKATAAFAVFFVLLSCPVVLARNVRLGFAQIAVGDSVTTIVDMTNRGIEAFEGMLSVLGDEGEFLPVSINGTPVSEELALNVAPGALLRLEISGSGPARPGHVIVHDSESLKTVKVNQQIDGTLIFQIKDGAALADSIGVPASATVFYGSGLREHFYFLGEKVGSVRTGLALSNAGEEKATLMLQAYSDSAQLLGQANLSLDPLHHQAFFIDERIALPEGFRGTVVVESDQPVFALALRLEENQLSTIQVSPVSAIYDFEIELFDGRNFSGEMTMNIADGTVQGFARFTSKTPDTDYELTPVTGGAMGGRFIVSLYTSFDGIPATIVLFDPSVRTSDPEIRTNLVWMEPLGGTPVAVGNFRATRR